MLMFTSAATLQHRNHPLSPRGERGADGFSTVSRVSVPSFQHNIILLLQRVIAGRAKTSQMASQALPSSKQRALSRTSAGAWADSRVVCQTDLTRLHPGQGNQHQG